MPSRSIGSWYSVILAGMRRCRDGAIEPACGRIFGAATVTSGSDPTPGQSHPSLSDPSVNLCAHGVSGTTAPGWCSPDLAKIAVYRPLIRSKLSAWVAGCRGARTTFAVCASLSTIVRPACVRGRRRVGSEHSGSTWRRWPLRQSDAHGRALWWSGSDRDLDSAVK